MSDEIGKLHEQREKQLGKLVQTTSNKLVNIYRKQDQFMMLLKDDRSIDMKMLDGFLSVLKEDIIKEINEGE